MKSIILAILLGCSQILLAQEVPAPVVTASTFKNLYSKEKGQIIDVRTPEEFAQGHVKKATNSDFRSGDFAKDIAQLDKTKTYYLYCASGNRSGKALSLMKEAGFTHVYNIGGFKELEAAGIPVQKPKKKE